MGSIGSTMAAGEGASWLVVGGLAAVVALQSPLGCLPDGADPIATPEQRALLEGVGPEVVVPTLTAFRQAAGDLEVAIDAWASGGGDTARTEAREPFLRALAAWQEAEVLQFGPMGSSAAAAGGADLRDEIYSWPTINPCRVDQETVEDEFGAPSFFEGNLVNVYGLDALEHLLFYDQATNDCPNQIGINAEGTWGALGPAGIDALRAAYAAAILADVLATTDALIETWDPARGDFGANLARPDRPGSPYEDAHHALNDVFAALFYVEVVTKDLKLAEPLGLNGCTSACDERVEGWISRSSAASIAANLRGFVRLFTGGSEGGFDDLLQEAGHGDLSARILENAEAAIAAADAIDRPLDTLIVTDRDVVVALYDALKAVTDDVKGDLVTVLELEIPNEASGDND